MYTLCQLPHKNFFRSAFIFDVITFWGYAEMLLVGPVEGGIILKSALGIYLGGRFSGTDQLSGHEQPLNGDVFPNRGAGGLLEDPV